MSVCQRCKHCHWSLAILGQCQIRYFLPTHAFVKIQAGCCLQREVPQVICFQQAHLNLCLQILFVFSSQCPLLNIISHLAYLGGMQSIMENHHKNVTYPGKNIQCIISIICHIFCTCIVIQSMQVTGDNILQGNA